MRVRQRPVLRPQPGGDVPAVPGARGRGASAARRSPTACDIELDFKKRHFPVFTPPDEKTPEEYLRELCETGPARALRRRTRREAARDRLEHELGIICRMGFACYFLIVWDFVRFARENGIPARPAARRAGRSSATCSSSATSARSSTTCCSSGSSTRTAPRRPTSTSTSARTAARRSSTTSAEVRRGERRPDRHLRHAWRPRRRSRTSAGCWTSRSSASTS